MSIMKKLLLIIIILLTASLIASYAFFPSIARYIIQQQLPSDTKLSQLVIKRPDFQGLLIEKVIIEQVSIEQVSTEQTSNRLELQNTHLIFNWIPFSLQAIQLDSADLLVQQPQALNKAFSKDSSNYNDINNQQAFNPASLLQSLPKITIEKLQATVQKNVRILEKVSDQKNLSDQNKPGKQYNAYPEIILTGSLIHNDHELQGSFNLNSDRNISGKLNFISKDKQTLTINGQLNRIDLKQLNSLLITENPISNDPDKNKTLTQQFSGMIDLSFDGTLNLNTSSNANQNIQTNLLDIINLETKLSLQKAAIETDNIALNSINGDINIRKENHWHASGSSITGNLDTSKLKLAIKPSSLNFRIELNEFQLVDNRININTTLTIEDKHRLTIKSNIPLDMSTASQHQLTLQLISLDDRLSSLLKDINIDKITADSTFELHKQQDQWHLLNLKSQPIMIDTLSIKKPTPTTAHSISLHPTWKTDIKFSDVNTLAAPNSSSKLSWLPEDTNPTVAQLLNQLRQLTIKSNKLIEFSKWQSEIHNDIEASLDLSNQQFSLKWLPVEDTEKPVTQTTTSNRSVIAMNGDLSGKLTPSKINFHTNFQADIKQIKPLLKRLQKKPGKLINNLTLNHTNQLSLNTSLNGQWAFNTSTADEAIQLAGSIKSSDNSITLSDTKLSDIMLKLIWQAPSSSENNQDLIQDNPINEDSFSPWNNFQLILSADLDYQGLDQQQHQFSSDIWLSDPIKIKQLTLDSKLLDGSLSLQSLKQYKPLNQVSGTLNVDHISLKKISRIMDKPELAMTGFLNGDLPFHFKDGYLNFEKGLLSSENGVIEYLPQGKKIELTQETVSNIANITLQNFHYRVMNANLISGGPCGFDFKIRLEGHNPDIGKNSHQVFNINYQPQSNVNLFYLLLLGKENIKKLDQTLLHSGCVNNN